MGNLFLSGNEIGMKKPIPVIAIFLHKVISLMTSIYNPVLWGIIGTEEISKQIRTQIVCIVKKFFIVKQ